MGSGPDPSGRPGMTVMTMMHSQNRADRDIDSAGFDLGAVAEADARDLDGTDLSCAP